MGAVNWRPAPRRLRGSAPAQLHKQRRRLVSRLRSSRNTPEKDNSRTRPTLLLRSGRRRALHAGGDDRFGRGPGAGRRRGRVLVTFAFALEAVAGSSRQRKRLRRSRCRGYLSRSETQAGGGGHHRRAPGVHRGDDLFSVDALEIDRGRAEVGVAELALDHVERHALAGELDGMGVAQLVRREAPPDTRLGGEPAELDAHVRARPRPPASRAVDDAEQAADREQRAASQG